MSQASNRQAALAIAMVAMHLSGCTRNEAEPTEANLLDAFARSPDVCATRFPLPLEVLQLPSRTAGVSFGCQAVAWVAHKQLAGRAPPRFYASM